MPGYKKKVKKKKAPQKISKKKAAPKKKKKVMKKKARAKKATVNAWDLLKKPNEKGEYPRLSETLARVAPPRGDYRHVLGQDLRSRFIDKLDSRELGATQGFIDKLDSYTVALEKMRDPAAPRVTHGGQEPSASKKVRKKKKVSKKSSSKKTKNWKTSKRGAKYYVTAKGNKVYKKN